jgi:hypothetical protein
MAPHLLTSIVDEDKCNYERYASFDLYSSLGPLFRSICMYNIVTCGGLCVTYRRVLNWMIEFIYIFFTQLGTTGNFIIIVDLHTLQFTVTHAVGFSVFTSHILATDL